MASPRDPFSILNKGRGLISQVQVKKLTADDRYWAGKQIGPEDSSSEDDIFQGVHTDFAKIKPESQNQKELNEQTHSDDEEDQNARKNVLNKRQVHQSQIISNPDLKHEIQHSVGFSEEEEEIPKPKSILKAPTEVHSEAERRRKLRLKLQEEAEASESGSEDYFNEKEDSKGNMEENEEEDSMIEEYEQSKPLKPLLKPVFVPKGVRFNQAEEKTGDIFEEVQEKIKEFKKEQAKNLLFLSVRQGEVDEQDSDNQSTQELPNDDDAIDQQYEFEQWQIRELNRIKKEKEEYLKIEKEKQEMERRRNLTDLQRQEENKKLGSDATNTQQKTKYTFLQKYYHVGAFYRDGDEDIFKRDYNVAVGEDLQDKSTLPVSKQKRRGDYGKKGQSKYTHLTNEDTTNYNPEQKVDDKLQEKMFSKYGGLKGQSVLERSHLKKLKM